MPGPDIRAIQAALPVHNWCQTMDYVFGYPAGWTLGGEGESRFWQGFPVPPISVIVWELPPEQHEAVLALIPMPLYMLSVHQYPPRNIELPRDTEAFTARRVEEDPKRLATAPLTALVGGMPALLLDSRWALMVGTETARMYAYEAWIPRPTGLFSVRSAGPVDGADFGKSCFTTALGTWTWYR
jgi:hypothetical protein